MNNGSIVTKYYEQAAWLCILLLLAGILFSRAMASIGMVGLFSLALLNPNVGNHISIYLKSPVLWSFSLILGMYLLSGLYSENLHDWWTRVNTKLALVALPFGFILVRKQSLRSFHWLLYVFLWLATVTSIFVLVHYLKSFDLVNFNYSRGQVMETPYSHVRFSLMICFAIIIGGYLYQSDFQPLFRGEKILILVATIFLVVFIHILAVRSGLLALYLCALFISIRYIYLKRKWKMALPALLILFSLPLLAYWSLPSFREKFNYVRYDLQNYFRYENKAGLSDAGRILSIENGMEIGKKNFLLGVGAGDLQQEANQFYINRPEIDEAKRLPHNQFVWVFASTGIIGLLIFCWAVILPLFYQRNFTNPLFVCLHIIVLSSFFTEATLEEQIGTCFYLVFMLLIYNQLVRK